MDEITLTDLIDARTLQSIQDAFSNATGMAALTVDLNGPVTRLSNPTDFCMKLTRGCPKGADRCNECDLRGGQEAGRTGRPSVYYCHGGLMDFAAPVLLGDKQVGSLIGGQVLPEPPDEAKFRRIAREIGVDEEEYVRAVRKVKIVPKKTIEASAQLLYTMANALSDVGYQKYRTKRAATELLEVSRALREKVQVASDSIRQIEAGSATLMTDMQQLSESTKRSRDEVEKTNQIVKYISDVSMQTKLLGFNASVEASRAKEYGAGFNVIAQEIRRLADTSQTQFSEIDRIISAVKHTILDIDSKITAASGDVASSTGVTKNATDVIGEILDDAKRLEELGKEL